MTRLGDYLGDYSSTINKQARLDGLINLYDFVSKAGSGTGSTPTIGLDTLVNSWVRQQFAYREQMQEDLVTLSRTVSEIAAPLIHLKGEVFRRGIKIEPKFAKKCSKCGHEHDYGVDECEKCESKELINPDDTQLEHFESFLDDSGVFDQSLEDVLKQFHEYLNVLDDGFLYIPREYAKIGGAIRSKPKEIRTLRTAAIDFDLDETGLPKNKHWICLFHRDLPPKDKEGVCEVEGCGMPLKPAMYKYKHRGQILWILDNEICHCSKFFPSETFGYSPLLIVFEKALVMLGMDRSIFRYFFERKMPSGIVMVSTDDPNSVRRAKDEMVAQLRSNPDHIPMIGYSQKTGRGRVDFVRLFHTLQEMDYLPVRQEIRDRIASLWGLPPLWQSEMTGFGGLSGQSQQLVQFSRVVESDQRIFNEKVFPFIAEAFGITDWKITLQQPEEKAEASRIAFAQQKSMTAMTLKQLGFKVELKKGVKGLDDIDFTISEAPEGQQMGQFGGFFPPGGGEQQGIQQPPQEEEQPQPPGGQGWGDQLTQKGYPIDSIHDIGTISNGITAITFSSKGQTYAAAFQPTGGLIDVMKYKPMKAPMARATKQENSLWKPEKPEEAEIDDEDQATV